MSEAVTPATADALPVVSSVVPEPAASTAIESPEAATAATPETDEQPRDPSTGRFSKRTEQLTRQIGDLTATKHSLQRQVETLAQRAQTLHKQISEPAQIDPNDFDAQQRDTVSRAVKQDRYEQTVDEVRGLQDLQLQTMKTMFDTKVEAAKERIPDLDTALQTFIQIPISNYACEVIAESDKAPEIAYWLAKNPVEARRIASLTPARQGVEVARIESKVTTNPAKRISQAPPPPNTLQGGSGTTGIDLNTADMATYMKARMGTL